MLAIDAAVAVLRERKDAWARLPIPDKVELLRGLRHRTDALAERWVTSAARAKGIPADSPWVGEEWSSGPWALLYGIDALQISLEALAHGRPPDLRRGAVRVRPDGQVVVRVFPPGFYDWLLLNGVRAEVWMQREVTAANLRQHMAGFYQKASPEGKVAAILGAGNLSSIAPLDVLHKLFAEGQVVVLKMNPVNDYLGPVFEEIFAEIVAKGFVRFVYGGADVGAFVVAHDDVDEIHITGSEHTYDAIRFGTGPDAGERKMRNDPVNRKRITAELGGAGPTIVLPGQWTPADIRFQAENIATQKLHNAGFNCVASQVLILPESWDQKDALLNAVRSTIRALPPRVPYYPGAAQRQQAAMSACPTAELLDAPGPGVVPRTLIPGVNPSDSHAYAFTEEFFGGVLAQTALPGRTAAEFLGEAIRFANGTLRGTLGANIIAHPSTLAELGEAFETAIADLRYGTIGVNAWVGVAFLLPQASWGAFPGHPDNDIQSGQGAVHNALLFDKPERTIVFAPFEPFHRAMLHGRFHLSPKPPWFVTNRRADEVCRRVTRFAANPGLRHLPGIFAAALRG